MSWREELLALVDEHLAGGLDARGQAALERLLAEQPEAGRLYWVAVQHEVMLRSALAGAVQADEPVPVPRRRRRRFAPLLAAAALVLLAVGAALGGWLTQRPPPVAEVGELAAGAPGEVRRRDGSTVPLAVGLELGAGDRIAAGAGAVLRWRGEATTITLAAAAVAELARGDDAEHLMLDQGSLEAEVAAQLPGQTFAIATPQARVSVLGTRFSVLVAGERTEVAVVHGRVRVAARGGDAGVEIGAGGRAMRLAGRAPVVLPAHTWAWSDRRPLGVVMLSGTQGSATNPRGWFNDPGLEVTSPAFTQRVDAQLDLTIALLHEQGAQGVVFWDLEGREHPLGYVGDPRQLARFAPEMDAVADHVFARLRAAGFRVGVALRAQAVQWEDQGRTPNLRAVSDPAALLLEKIAYARTRWGATLFPILGQSGNAIGMETICRRIVGGQPDLLLMPTAADADTYRWCGAWQDPQSPSVPGPEVARREVGEAFGVFKPLDAPLLEQRFAELVRASAAGDILSFRAWWRDPGNDVLRRIRAAAGP